MTDQKIALVTGANAGMGRATAIALMKKGYYVVMLCRNRQRGEAALEQARREAGSGSAALMLCDLGNMADIRRFCGDFSRAYSRLDVLINNAGVLSFARRETHDGLELHFGVCHIGHFLLTLSLLPLMGAGGRIVSVSSVAHKIGRIHFDDIGMKKRYNVLRAYSRAKLCNVLFTRELAARLKNRDIAVNCAHPGMVVTNIGGHRKESANSLSRFRILAGRLLRFMVKTPEEGAATAIYIATSPDCEGVSGEYFANGKIARVSKRAKDSALAARLWALSEQITGISYESGSSSQ